MHTYQYMKLFDGTVIDNRIKRLPDGLQIPFNAANADYQQYLAWLAEGNSPVATDD